MKKMNLFVAAVMAVVLVGCYSGCAVKSGVAGLSVSGTFLNNGKVIDAGVTVGSNSVSVSGLFGQGTNTTYSGTVTVPVN
jgi:hypothetical protein